ncbi:MAG TPA: hypothetical protein VLD37_06350 [Candidatus Bilamarchaeum sp.]|nr:hypothetical protein [Candidatus Bilamarchaeum sp.]
MEVRPRHLEERKSSPRNRQVKPDEQDVQNALVLAKQYLEGIRSRPKPKAPADLPADLEEIRLSYVKLICGIAAGRGVSVWEAERQILPDDIKNLRSSPYGLPETLIPFSPSVSWKNALLEQALQDLPDKSNVLFTIARILDRYVQTGFPLEAVSEFYRTEAAELQIAARELDEPAYLFRLIALSRELTKKHHNLKNDLHKSEYIQTGDALPQANPDVISRIKLTKLPLRKDGETTGQLARSLMQKLRVPAVDGIIPPNYAPPSARDLQSQLEVVLKPGQDATYSHSGLPGMEFTAGQCSLAYGLTIYGDFFTTLPHTGLKAPLPLAPLLNSLFQDQRFTDATARKDRQAQLGIALELVGKAAHVAAITGEDAALSEADAWKLAEEDFTVARRMVVEYRDVRFTTPDHMTLTGVKKMLQMAKEHQQMPEFEIALSVIRQKRANRESLTTLRPPPPELVSEASAPPAAEPPVGRLVFPFSNDPIDLDLEKHLPKGDEGKLVRRVARTIRYFVSLGQTDNVPHVYLPAVTRLLAVYSHEELVDFARVLAEEETRARKKTKGDTLVMFAPVQEQPEAAQAQDAAPPRVATTLDEIRIDEETPIPAASPVPQIEEEPQEETRPDFRPITVMFEKLSRESPNALELAMEILGKTGQCAESDLEEFTRLHPGVRDLRFRNRLARVWTGGDWRGQPEVGEPSEREHLQSCLDTLYRVCGLSSADLGEMYAAATNPANLTPVQLEAVGKVFGVAHNNVTPQMIEGFGLWLTGEPQKLKTYWDQHYPNVFALINLSGKVAARAKRYTPEEMATLGLIFRKPADKISADDLTRTEDIARYIHTIRNFESFWFGTGMDARRDFWKSGKLDTLAAADLVHRVVFLTDWQYRPEDFRLMTRINQHNPADQNEMNNMTTAFVNELLRKSDGKAPYAAVVNLHDQLAPNPFRDILCSAQEHEEFATLAQFLGVQHVRAAGTLVSKDSVCRPKIVRDRYSLVDTRKDQTGVFLDVQRKAGGKMVKETVRFVSHSKVGNDEFVHVEFPDKQVRRLQMTDAPGGGKTLIGEEKYNETNDDSLSQAVVSLENGETIELDAVFDGMGGHEGGYLASGFMKQVFEVAALSGWITRPEDMRKVIVLADAVITLEQHKKGQYGSTKMGTTATIGFLRGDEFFEAHVGDSDVKLYREGKMIYSSLGHSFVNQVLESGLPVSDKVKEVAEVIAKYGTSVNLAVPGTSFKVQKDDSLKAVTDGRTVSFTITRDGSVFCQGTGEPMLYEKLIEAFGSEHGNIVTGAVGHTISAMTINNKKQDYAPLKIRAGDVRLLCSDGLTVPLCSHEFPIVIEQCGGDMKQAAEMIVDLAEQRRPNGQKEFKPLCTCCERGSKNDDKSIVLKKV